jgi:hypothetical protein
MKKLAINLREDFTHLTGCGLYEACPPTRWKSYAEWLEKKLLEKLNKQHVNTPTTKTTVKEATLFGAKVHYANALIIQYNPDEAEKLEILNLLDKARNYDQLKTAYTLYISKKHITRFNLDSNK